MMVLDLVGGGGRVKLVVEIGCDCPFDGLLPFACLGAIAGGPKLKALSVAERGAPSLPWISVEAPGVGGRLVRGMMKEG